MNVFSKSWLVRVAVCAATLVCMAVYGFAALASTQVAHGTSFPPDPWDGKSATQIAHGTSFPPDPWDGKDATTVAHGTSFPPDPWDGKSGCSMSA